jgi:hypothetical protein
MRGSRVSTSANAMTPCRAPFDSDRPRHQTGARGAGNAGTAASMAADSDGLQNACPIGAALWRCLRPVPCDPPDPLLEAALLHHGQNVTAPSSPIGPQGVTKTGGAKSHGRPQAKDVAFPSRHASQSPGAAPRGPRRVRQLWRTETAASRLQPLRLLRRTRGCAGRRCAEGRGSRLTPGRGVASLLP